MQVFLMICIGLLLASCGGERQPKSTVAAIESGEKTRVEWQKARKPVAIRIEGMEGTRCWAASMWGTNTAMRCARAGSCFGRPSAI